MPTTTQTRTLLIFSFVVALLFLFATVYAFTHNLVAFGVITAVMTIMMVVGFVRHDWLKFKNTK